MQLNIYKGESVLKKITEKLFINVVCNAIIAILIVSVFVVSFSGNITNVFGFDSEKAIYRGNESKNNVSIMINVYWGTEHISPMLKILNDFDVKATFFVGGSWVTKNEEVFKEIFNAGHEIGNHGFYHKDHAKLDFDGNYNEIFITHKLVNEILGIDMDLFAPPSGSFSKNTLKVASQLNYRTIMWSKDTIDWRDKDSQLILKRATTDIKNGELILMHPTKDTVDALEKILEFYEKNGFKVVPVGENITND